MTIFLFSICILACLVQIAWALRRRGGILEYPFLTACVFLFFMLTQTYRVSQLAEIREDEIDRVLVMTFCCIVASFAGYVAAGDRVKQFVQETQISKLQYFAIGSVVFGAFFMWRLRNLPEEMLAQSQWSGATVAFAFLSRPLFCGGMLALILYLSRGLKSMLILALIVLTFIFVTIAFGGRRGPLFEFLIGTASIIFFVRGKQIPNLAAVMCVPLALLFVNGIVIYRATTMEGTTAMSAIGFEEYFYRVGSGLNAVYSRYDELLVPEHCEEVKNACYYLRFISGRDQYDYGTGLWDSLVIRFFPGQLLGYENKKGLQFSIISGALGNTEHRRSAGTTFTGLTDAFQAFGYLGCVYFFVAGYIVRVLWNNALRGDLFSQLFYVCLIKPYLEAITHSSYQTYMGIVETTIFLGVPLFLLGRKYPLHKFYMVRPNMPPRPMVRSQPKPFGPPR